MTVNYTTNLALGQPVTGTESGTWGDDVNNSVTSYLDIAIAGGLAITVTTTDVTLTLTQGTSSATNIGSTTAQYAILNVSGAMTAARNLILPSSSRQYVINNNTTGGYALTVKGSATSGVTMVNGEKAQVFWNGSDYAKLSNTANSAGTFSSITNTGLTSGRVVYTTTGGLEAASAALTFDGTDFATTGTATAAKLIPTGTSVTGNGMYLPATNSLGFSTAGINAVYINASQNVGIGQAANLTSKLTVKNSITFDRYGDATEGLTISTNGGNAVYNTFGGENHVFQTAGTERMRIDTSSGALWVGTNAGYTPTGGGTVKQVISADQNGRTSLVITNQNAGSSASASVIIGAYGSDWSITNGSIANNNTSLTINRGTSEFVRIDSSGNVGIGTSSPSSLLTIGTAGVAVGTAFNSKFNVNGGTVGSTTGNTAKIANLGFDAAINNHVGLGITAYRNSTGSDWTTTGIKFTYDVDNTAAVYDNLLCFQGGNVGIGTSSPAEKLNVVGGNIKTDSSSRQIGYWEADAVHDGYMVPYNAFGQIEIVSSYTSGAVLFKTGTSKTERMRIDASGNVGIGASTTAQLRSQLTVLGAGQATAALSDSGNTDGTIQINSNVNAGNRGGALTFGALLDNNTYTPFAAIKGLLTNGGGNGTGDLAFSLRSVTGNSTLTEAMRISGVGNLLVGATSSASVAKVTAISDSSGAYYQMMMNNTDTGSGNQISMDIYRNSTRVGYISTTNLVCTFTSVSDYRLKENVQPMQNALAKVALLKPVTYKWKSDGSAGQGFIAHELQEVVPDCVSGTKDALDKDGNIDAQGIDTSFLVATLTAAIQEQQALITSLTARITALEST